jgi:hypothetical protein
MHKKKELVRMIKKYKLITLPTRTCSWLQNEFISGTQREKLKDKQQ